MLKYSGAGHSREWCIKVMVTIKIFFIITIVSSAALALQCANKYLEKLWGKINQAVSDSGQGFISVMSH